MKAKWIKSKLILLVAIAITVIHINIAVAANEKTQDICLENNEQAISTAPISISTSVNRTIPSSTSLIAAGGVVSDGQPTYEVSVTYKFMSAASFSGAATMSIMSMTPNGGEVKAVSGTSCGLNPSYSKADSQYVYMYTLVLHVRSISDFTVKCTIHDTNSESITSKIFITLPTVYKDKFLLTYYIIAEESEYAGNRNTDAAGISGKKYKSSFLADVKIQGSGYSQDGEYIQYNPTTNKYSIVAAPQTASGTVPTEGRTIAVDNKIIPRKGSLIRAKVYIADVGYRQAEDAGGAINGNHIDVFYGIGHPSSEPSWNMQYKTVTYYGNNLY